jgi:hypothetical protein
MAENENNGDKQADDFARYLRAGHAIQTAVGYEQSTGSKDGSPKHLRTGINLSKTDQCALVKLLIARGLFTEAEYIKAIADEAEAEVERYQLAHPRIKFH